MEFKIEKNKTPTPPEEVPKPIENHADSTVIETQLHAAAKELDARLNLGIEPDKIAEILVNRTKHRTNPNAKKGEKSILSDTFSKYQKAQHVLESAGDKILHERVDAYIKRYFGSFSSKRIANLRQWFNSNLFLSVIGARLMLDGVVFVSESEIQKQDSVSQSRITADALEALLGLISREKGEQALNEFIETHILPPPNSEEDENRLVKSFIEICSSKEPQIIKGFRKLVGRDVKIKFERVDNKILNEEKRWRVTIGPDRPSSSQGEIEPIETVAFESSTRVRGLRFAISRFLGANKWYLLKADGPISIVPQRRIRFSKS